LTALVYIYIYILGGDPGEDPGHAGEITSPGWPGNASGSHRMSWKMLREVWVNLLGLLPPRPDPGISG